MKKIAVFCVEGWTVGAVAVCLAVASGCVSNRAYYTEPGSYLQRVEVDGDPTLTSDLAVVEFDEHGQFWDVGQLEDTIALIEQRNREATRGVFVFVYIHGWKNNADATRTQGDLAGFYESVRNVRRSLATLGTAFRDDHAEGEPSQRHLVTHAEGHIDYPVSHRAEVVDGEVELERVPGASNDTPVWVVRVTEAICADHSDPDTPNLSELFQQIYALNRAYDAGVRTTLYPRRPRSGG
ncbi:MAG: hypothetical protein AAGG38_05180 [Planctomycetota bacterium]